MYNIDFAVHLTQGDPVHQQNAFRNCLEMFYAVFVSSLLLISSTPYNFIQVLKLDQADKSANALHACRGPPL